MRSRVRRDIGARMGMVFGRSRRGMAGAGETGMEAEVEDMCLAMWRWRVREDMVGMELMWGTLVREDLEVVLDVLDCRWDLPRHHSDKYRTVFG